MFQKNLFWTYTFCLQTPWSTGVPLLYEQTSFLNAFLKYVSLFAGKYRGAACATPCNIEYKSSKKITCVFHNFKNYDGKFLFKELVTHPALKQVKILGQTIEKFISVECKRFRFLDSYAHVISSLDKIAENLKKHGTEHFIELLREFPNPQKHELLLGKGKFPYEYLTDLQKLYEKCPPHEQFYSSLKNENISVKEYETVQEIMTVFKLKNLKGLLELYVKQDVIILCDCLNFYRKMVRKNYNLEAFCYISSPGLSLDAALKMTNAKIELLTDSDQYMFVENGVRGGIAMASTHFCEANNRYMSTFNNSKPESYIFYADVTNLYGHCLSQKLPISNFKWVTLTESEIINKATQYNHVVDEIGYLLEVDLHIPIELHDYFSDYPPVAERLQITELMISPWTKILLNNKKHFSSVKLAPNLYDKIKYICHVQNLKLYLELGIELKKVHRVLSFKQSSWLFAYIEFNSNERAKAVSDVEKDFFKLLINSLFGKMIENVRKYRIFDIATDEKKRKRLVSKLNLKDVYIINDDVMIYEFTPIKVKLCKPIFVGMVCLELAKHFMVEYHYQKFVRYFKRENIKLLYTDTDSFIWQIFTGDLYNDLIEFQDDFDFSKYPTNHKLYNNHNRFVRGKWKDEKNGNVIYETVFLRAKSYSICDSESNFKAAAGVNKCTQKLLTHDDYKNVLFNSDVIFVSQKRFGSDHHQVFTYDNVKCALNSVDDKRYQANKIESYPYGHYLLDFKTK